VFLHLFRCIPTKVEKTARAVLLKGLQKCFG
jgi:hypothetical protein